MKLSDLQHKNVINLFDGKNIGNIIDINVDSNGKIIELVIEKHRFILFYFFSKKEFKVKWSEIEKIGEDVILVRVVY